MAEEERFILEEKAKLLAREVTGDALSKINDESLFVQGCVCITLAANFLSLALLTVSEDRHMGAIGTLLTEVEEKYKELKNRE